MAPRLASVALQASAPGATGELRLAPWRAGQARLPLRRRRDGNRAMFVVDAGRTRCLWGVTVRLGIARMLDGRTLSGID